MIVESYYDKELNPISTGKWKALLNNSEYKRVAETIVTSPTDLTTTYTISTIWVGVSDGMFETILFGKDDETLGQERYSTEEEAKEGHTLTVHAVADTLKDAIVMEPK